MPSDESAKRSTKWSATIDERIRAISQVSEEQIGDDLKAKEYLQEGELLVGDITKHINKARTATNSHKGSSREDNKELKRALDALDESDSLILREQLTLAFNKARVNMRAPVLGRMSQTKIGEAYMMSITDNLPVPAGRSMKLMGE